MEAEGGVSAIPPIISVFSTLLDPASSSYLSHSPLSQFICTCTDHPNVFTLAQVASAKERRHPHISSSIYLTTCLDEIVRGA